MIKLPYGKKLCKITNSPYQGFRWKAGPDGRFKETIVSFVIAKERNICQCCLNDMQFGLPVGVRDQLLKESSNQQVAMPRSDVGMRYHYEQLSRDSSDGSQQLMSMTDGMNNISKINQLATFSNMKQVAAARHNSTAFRNLPKLCSFWLNGTCGRVKNKSCPFRPCCGTFVFPELASSHKELMAELVASLTEHGADHVQKKMSNDLRAAFRESLKGNKDQAIRKRVYGEDELSSKYLGAMKAAVRRACVYMLCTYHSHGHYRCIEHNLPSTITAYLPYMYLSVILLLPSLTMSCAPQRVELEPPADPSVCTLWVGNVDSDEIGEADLGGAFYAFGMVTGVTVVRASRCVTAVQCSAVSQCSDRKLA